MIQQELTYWITLALIPKLYTKRKMELYISCYNHHPRKSIVDLFEDRTLWTTIGMTTQEMQHFSTAHEQLVNNAFLVEDLLNQGYEIIPVHSEAYPKQLKENLKTQAPLVLFAKGDIRLLQEPSIAIVGSRNADDISLTFTDNIAKRATKENKVVVSGFAKGVDRKALDATLEADGKSIIVLPQGIMTFASGFKQYYKPINQGKVLVISTFAPKAPWSVELAMARNSTIYGLAKEIYVAQSDTKGGTWSGVVEGLKKNRPIFVRLPEHKEKNANMLLIEKGATGVDMYGEVPTITTTDKEHTTNAPQPIQQELPFFVEEATPQYATTAHHPNVTTLNTTIINILQSKESVSLAELKQELAFEISDTKLRNLLYDITSIETIKMKNKNYYKLKQL